MQLMRSIAAKPWQHVLVLALVTLVAGKLIYKKLFPEHFQLLHVVVLAASMVLVRFMAELPAGWQRMRALRGHQASLSAQLLALIPEGSLGLLRFGAAQMRGTACWLMRKRPCPAPGPGHSFAFYNKSQYPTVFIIAMLSCAVEIPLNAMIMGLLEPDPVRRVLLQKIILTGLVLTVLWMIGDRHWLRSTIHVLNGRTLTLRLGARLDATIPLAAIADAFPIKSGKELAQPMNVWLRKNGFDPGATVIGSPFDLPNVVLVLDPAAPVIIDRFKIRQKGVRQLLLYVDDPAALIQSLSRLPAL